MLIHHQGMYYYYNSVSIIVTIVIIIIIFADVLDYLNSTWLNKYKEMFVSVWTNECLHFGNQTTNRAESQHAKLKKFLNSVNCTLDKIVRHIDEVVNSQYTIVKDSFEKSRTVLMHKHNLPMLKLLHGSVSHEALDIIIAERHLKRSHCRCQVRKCYGLPCACEISKYKKAGQSIPLDSVDEFWRKLELPVYCEDITCDVELENFKQAFDNRSMPGKKSLLQKLKALTNPSIPFLEEPDVKKNTRGRPTTKSKQQTIPNPAIPKPPLQRSYSQKPPRHSSFTNYQEQDYTQEPARHSSFTNYQEQDYTQEPAMHSSFTNYQEQDYTQEPWRHSSFGYLETDDYVGYISPDVNYQVPGETSPFTNQDIYGKKPFKDYPGEPSPFMTQDTDGQGFFTNLLNTPGYDFMGLNQDIVGQSSFANSTSAPGYDFMGLNQDQASQVIHNYIHLIPKIFHAYVTRIHNVLGDGNCGFRATASALGYGEDEWLFIRRSLMEELLEFRNKYTKAFLGSFKDVFTSLAWSGSGFAPEKHWMIMPEAGFLIANKFNVIVHFLSQEKRNSSTCFSLWRGPHEFPEKKIITIAHVNGNHFIMVELQGEYPITSTNNLWKLMRENDAAGWENIFESRQNMYKSWIAQPATFGGSID
ncbi:putative OTU domain, FHY3/FAR1 family protein [Helianthus annuus]|nr:putative OTU domain, FHY3/FAR1 family protein [Helianthus annuus]